MLTNMSVLSVAKTGVYSAAGVRVALGFFVLCCSAAAVCGATYSYERYTSILSRAPFGPLPPDPDKEAVQEAEAEADPVVPEEVPPGLDSVKVVLLTRFGGKPAAGFTDSASGTVCYLMEGQSWEDFTLVSTDMENLRIRLRRGEVEAELPLWINPATTNSANLATFGMTPEALAKAASEGFLSPTSVVASAVSAVGGVESKADDELERRRAEWRANREEERRKRREELAKMTPEERKQYFRRINMEIIKTGSGPPLPIELNESEMRELAEEGFAVPGYNVPRSESAESTGSARHNPVRNGGD